MSQPLDPPDFDQLARETYDTCTLAGWADQLRKVWDARGAADVAHLSGDISRLSGRVAPVIRRVIEGPGYNVVSLDAIDWTNAEKIELADFCIAQWEKFKADALSLR